MSRSMHERLKFTSDKDRELFCGLATPSDVRELVDAIERLQKESIQSNVQLRSELTGAHDAMGALAKALTKAEQERDAALAEVARLRGALQAAHGNDPVTWMTGSDTV